MLVFQTAFALPEKLLACLGITSINHVIQLLRRDNFIILHCHEFFIDLKFQTISNLPQHHEYYHDINKYKPLCLHPHCRVRKFLCMLYALSYVLLSQNLSCSFEVHCTIIALVNTSKNMGMRIRSHKVTLNGLSVIQTSLSR